MKKLFFVVVGAYFTIRAFNRAANEWNQQWFRDHPEDDTLADRW